MSGVPAEISFHRAEVGDIVIFGCPENAWGEEFCDYEGFQPMTSYEIVKVNFSDPVNEFVHIDTNDGIDFHVSANNFEAARGKVFRPARKPKEQKLLGVRKLRSEVEAIMQEQFADFYEQVVSRVAGVKL
ncbi:hypothetical protein [Gluconobacter oxydans]|uniref:hypothetical protein n=1 Tax=Gluconobacter oxydans TaxID=442 RepID=UPI002649E4CB|nr:hypothetical protein [Gluconobacter oxydans]WKE49069.1 hypothetical protein NUJ38_04965 [Gluconobacter oxydans]